jgi:hypothetical protein
VSPLDDDVGPTGAAGSPDPGNFAIGGDPELLRDAARRLQVGVSQGYWRGHPPGEFAMLAIARLLEAVSAALVRQVALPPDVTERASEVARHVRRYLDLQQADRSAE